MVLFMAINVKNQRLEIQTQTLGLLQNSLLKGLFLWDFSALQMFLRLLFLPLEDGCQACWGKPPGGQSDSNQFIFDDLYVALGLGVTVMVRVGNEKGQKI